MFRVDMTAIREAAIEARLMASPANAANYTVERGKVRRPLATVATVAIRQQRSTSIDPAVTELLEAAMRVCDAWNDSEAAREQMRQDLLQTPPHLRADLLEHFKKTRNAPLRDIDGSQRNKPAN